MAQIAVAGPRVGAAFLEHFAGALRGLGHGVTLECADIVDPAALPGWAQTDVFLCAGAGCSREAIDKAPALRAIVSPVIGIDGIDLTAATEREVLVANGQVPENTQSMAEATIMLMLVALYDLHGSEARLRQAPSPASKAPSARMLRGKTIGILGFGSIARAVVERLAGWDARILVYARRTVPSTNVTFTDMETVLRESDVLLVLMSLNPGTHHLLNAERLALMKRDAILINTARGAVVDEQALAAQVASGHLTRVALDVFEVEPLPSDSPLRALPNAVLTPHCVGHTRESQAAIPPYALENIRMVLAGEVPSSVRNPDAVPAWTRRWQAIS